jgi:signal transduction histidine kinase
MKRLAAHCKSSGELDVDRLAEAICVRIVGVVFPIFLRALALSSTFLAMASAAAEDAPLTKCAAVRAMPREEAARGLPVVVRGVVTFFTPKKNWGMVLHDERDGEGIYVDGERARKNGLIPENPPWVEPLERGMLIELRGITGAGHFAPVIIPQHIEVLGTAPLPEPIPVTFSDVLNGRWDCQRVRLRGVIQYAAGRPDWDGTRLDIVAHGGRIVVRMFKAREDIAQLVDSEVELSCVMFTYFNNRGESVGAQAQVRDREDIRVVHAGPRDPFSAPERPLSMLRPFSRTGSMFHRCRCTGTVTVAQPGEFFYMQEGDRGVRVETRDPTPLKPGDRVEAAGFVEMADHFGKLREAVVRKVGVAPVPVPMPVERRRVIGSGLRGFVTDADDTDGRFASLRGRLEKVDFPDLEGPRLMLESEGALVEATLGRDVTPAALAHLEPGCELRLLGVVRVELASGWPAQGFPRPVSFGFVVNSPSDLIVERAAPWWTAQRLWLALSGTAVLLALALAWSARLQRRVAQRNAQLAEEMRARREAEVEFAATLRERERLAADLHDTLEQSLTGIGFGLETMVVRRARTQDYSEELDRVRQLFASTREDVRRSVWNLRVKALDGRTLPEAIQTVMDRLAFGRDVVMAVETEGEVRPLPDLIAGNLLLLAMEAVTNALKHAEPRSILVRVVFAAREIALIVEDDGLGFDIASAVGPQDGHFGIQGMRERMKRLGGTLEVSSEREKGSRIVARLELDQPEPVPTGA